MKLSSTDIRGSLRVRDELHFDMYPWIHLEQAFTKVFVDGDEVVLQDASGREFRVPISGTKGDRGEDGRRGTFWFTGVGEPIEQYGQIENDLYLDTAEGNLYVYKNGEWKVNGVIQGGAGERGPAGPPGVQGLQGPQGERGIAGKDGASVHIQGTLTDPNDLMSITQKERGDGYLINRELYVWDGLRWNNVGEIQGPKGEVGADGNTWFTGEDSPSNSLGKVGDHFLKTTTGDLFKKTSPTLWERDGNIQGPRGLRGPTGQDGRGLSFHWKDTQLGVKREMEDYFTYRDLRGPAGPKGDTGSTGAQGLRGERGEIGPAGPIGPIGPSGLGLNFEWNGTQLGIKRDDELTYQYRELQGQTGSIGPMGPTGATGPQGRQGIPGPAGPVGAQGCPGVGLQFQWDGNFLGIRREDEFHFQYQDLTGPAGPANVHIADYAPPNRGVLWCDISDVSGEITALCNLLLGPMEPIDKNVAWMETENTYIDSTCNLAVGPTPPANKQLVWMENATNTMSICRSEVSVEPPVDKQRVWFDISDREGDEPPIAPPEEGIVPICGEFLANECQCGI